MMLQAAASRTANNNNNSSNSNSSDNSSRPAAAIRSLKDICFAFILTHMIETVRLQQVCPSIFSFFLVPITHSPIATVQLPEDIAMDFLNHLIAKKKVFCVCLRPLRCLATHPREKVTPRTFRAFSGCAFDTLNFDSYAHMTNEVTSPLSLLSPW